MIKSGFSQDRATRVTRAQEKDVHICGAKEMEEGVSDKRFRPANGACCPEGASYIGLSRNGGACLRRLIAQSIKFAFDGHTV